MMHQQAPQSHYQPKGKMIQIGQSTSPKVSPKNIKELLKFRVGQTGQGPANVTNQSTNNQTSSVGGGVVAQGQSHNFQVMQK